MNRTNSASGDGLVLLFPDGFVQKIIVGKGAHLREGLGEVLISPGETRERVGREYKQSFSVGCDD